MNILAPANTLQSAVHMISCGADEIYLGADDGIFNTYSFTGRGKSSFGGIKVLNSFDELREIVKYAHDKNTKVNFLCNSQFYNFDCSTKIQSAFDKYIAQAIDAKVDAFVVGDIGILYYFHTRQINVPIHASLYFRSVNVEQLMFLKKLGVSRVTLPYLTTYEDICTMTQANIVDLEVTGYLGCSFYNGACNCLHALGEGVKDNFDQGIVCKSFYHICGEGIDTNGNVFDCELGCALCSLDKLAQIGIKAIKIVGRDRPYQRIGDIVSIYKNALSGDFTKKDLPEYWKRSWCKNNRCKFVSSKYMQHYI